MRAAPSGAMVSQRSNQVVRHKSTTGRSFLRLDPPLTFPPPAVVFLAVSCWPGACLNSKGGDYDIYIKVQNPRENATPIFRALWVFSV
jgi:hypothetical protein